MSETPPTCPRCSGPTRLRSSARGPFWSCCSYPTCRGIVDARAPGEKRAPPPPPSLGIPFGAQRVYGVRPGHSSDPHQQAVIDWIEGWAVVSAAAGCHPAGQQVMLASGECVPVEMVQAGDYLMGMDGQPRQVQQLIQGTGCIFEVTPTKGDAFRVNDQHILTLVGSTYRRINGKIIDVQLSLLNTRIIEDYKLFRVPVEVFHREVERQPLDPYSVGVLIGDGYLGCSGNSNSIVSVAKPDPEIRQWAKETATSLGMSLRIKTESGGKPCCPTYIFTCDDLPRGRYQKAPIRVKLEELGLYGLESGERFIPSAYKYGSVDTRLKVLAGILDTDGHMVRGGFDYISKSKRLADDVAFVARSLGLAAYPKPCKKGCQNGFVGAYFRLTVQGDCSIIPTRIRRKQAPARRQIKNVLRTGIFSIRPVGYEPYYGFQLDGDGRYLLGDFTVTHNSGKSHCLVERTATLLYLGEVPESICLLAFNTDAAKLLKDRLRARIGPAASRLEVRTFHAWCYALLRSWYPEDPRFWPGHILGGSDGPNPYKIAAPICSEIGIPVGLGLRAAEKVSEGLHPLNEGGVAAAMHWTPLDIRTGQVLRFLQRWATAKREHALVDFGDMLSEVALAIQNHPDNGAVVALKTLYRHVMVDECQDSSLPRAVVSRWLGQGSRSLLCVGDPCQSIASHAGARLDLFMELATAPGVTILPLPVNRRSTGRIVSASNEVARDQPWNISGNSLPLPTALEGEPVQVWDTLDEKEEAASVITDIQRRIAHGLPMEIDRKPSYACLMRTNAMLVDLESAFVARGISVRVVGSPAGVWGTNLGGDFLAYLEGVEGVASFGILNVANQPKRYAKKAEVGQVIEQAVEREKSGGSVDLHRSLKAHLSKGVQRLGSDLEQAATMAWRARCRQVARWLSEAISDDEPDEDRQGALEALCRLAQQLGSLAAIYNHKREASRGQREPAVELSTIHKSKGKEYPIVYGCGVRVDALPHKRAASEEEVEEERRLLYVLVTRARDALIISSGGTPSRFLRQLKWVRDPLKEDSEE